MKNNDDSKLNKTLNKILDGLYEDFYQLDTKILDLETILTLDIGSGMAIYDQYLLEDQLILMKELLLVICERVVLTEELIKKLT